ncbi:MAG: hypothetical protein H0W78_13470 [Planctomycetes bacterium]|nr:hypothetical protein [Planctomycetota bacterium]
MAELELNKAIGRKDSRGNMRPTATILETVERKTRISRKNFHGICLNESDDLALFHEECDFLFDGFCIFPTKDIVRRQTTACNQRVLTLARAENFLPTTPRWVHQIDLSNLRTALASIGSERVVIIENERIPDFWIGTLVEVDNTSCRIRHFDMLGKWMGVFRVPYRQVTVVKLDSRYQRIHQKYLKAK